MADKLITCPKCGKLIRKREVKYGKSIMFVCEKCGELVSFDRDDYVEVVRCKDCKYSHDEGMSGLWCDHPDNRNPCGCRPTDYCNDGERKENADD